MHLKKRVEEKKEQLNFISLNLVISKYLFANYLYRTVEIELGNHKNLQNIT